MIVAGVKMQQSTCLRADKLNSCKLMAYHIVLCEHEVFDTNPGFKKLL